LNTPTPRYDAAVDWVTLTLPASAGESDALRFRAAAEDALQDAGLIAERRGGQVLGYRGQASGKAFYGARPDGWLFRASGEQANRDYCREWPHTSRCTRVDLAVTVWREDWPVSVAHETMLQAIAARDSGHMHRSTKVCYYDGCGDGDSCYVGSRSSEQMLRCYDKGKESGETRYNGSWRWEIEYKGQRASQAWETLCEAQDAAQSIVATVETWLAERGIALGPAVGGSGCILTRVARGEGDDSARLEWLTRSVAPMIARLIDRCGHSAVYSALGLPF